MRVLVCGGRDFENRLWLYAVLDDIHDRTPITRIIHGDYDGADRLAQKWANDRGVVDDPYQADWKAHGRRAGPLRNSRMLAESAPDLVVAFPGNRGTADMVRKAKDAGVEVVEVTRWRISS